MKTSNSLKIGSICLLMALLVLSFSSPALAQAPAKPNATRVISDKMVAQRNEGVVEFSGNVKVTREDGTITSDRLQIHFDESQADTKNQNKIKKIVAVGNVEFISGARRAVSDKAVYNLDDEILILTGNAPRLWTGKSFVAGKKITLFRKSDQAMVESDGKSRVEAFFDPNDKETQRLKDMNN